MADLPTDYPRSHYSRQAHSDSDYALNSGAAPVFETVLMPIAEALQRLINRAAAEQGTTEAVWTSACYAAFLYKLTGSQDITFTAAQLRKLPSAVDSLASACHQVVVTSVGPTLASLLTQINQQWSNAASEDVLLTAAARAADTATVASELHPTSTGFFYHCATAGDTTLQPDWLIHLKPINGQATDDTLCIECTFNTQLNGHDTIVHRLDQFLKVLTQLSHEPDTPLDTISLITQRDQDLISRVNDTTVPLDPTLGFLAQFSISVERHAERTAVADNTGSLSYEQLAIRSNQLAHHLITCGAKRQDIIGICLPRGIEMVTAMLAIQKTGAAWLPLDPDHPESRLHYTVDHARVSMLVTASSVADIWAETHTRLVLLDNDEASLNTQPITSPARAFDADATAYVIYTSGSTGKPKGVRVTHRNLQNFLMAMQSTPGIDRNDTLLAVTTLSFDIAILELLLPLTVGASVVVCDRHTVLDGHALADALTRHSVTVMQATPTVWRLLLESGWTGKQDLNALAGGESLPPDLVAPLLQRTHALWNLYGPTETTIWSTCQKITNAQTPIRIGQPIDNTTVRILDAHNNPVAIGLTGELCIGGLGVSQGYLHRPDLTDERFVSLSGERLYRTGDLCRLLADGSLDYIGRIDNQIKLRGFRIETGEIESVLSEHNAVQQSIVGLSASADREPQLVAWYTSVNREPVSASALSEYVAQHVPAYMVPRYFEHVYAMPVTPNGKIARQALPQPKPVRPGLATLFVPAVGEQEKMLSLLWCDVLGIDSVGIDDSFFELGGNSISAVRMLGRLRTESGYHVGIVDLFKAPTITALAENLRKLQPREITPRDADAAIGSTAGAPRAADAASATRDSTVTIGTSTGHSGSNTSANAHNNTDGRTQQFADEDIAVIGMAARFPGASSVEAFWQNLIDGKETLTHFTADELDNNLSSSLTNDPNYVAVRGILDEVDTFDAEFFGVNPVEATVMDPQQRVLLQLCWHALENAGVVVPKNNKIAVYAGVNNNTYYTHNVLSHPEIVNRLGVLQTSIGNEKDYVATRIAHKLNLKGPAISLHTACSTSLVAIVEAFHALKAGRCDMALAGAASVTSPVNAGHVHQDGDIMSRDGHCSPFDDNASGTLFSDGAGVVVLKRLSDATANGDRIIAIVRGAAINNDGGDKMSFMSPGIEGQAQVITDALTSAGLPASAVSYVEAHGTATPVGDPVEIAALTQAYRQYTDATGYCAVGSVKSNIGHVTAAAGVAGFIKTCLALVHQQLPPSINYTKPNHRIDFETSPFYVNASLKDWTTENGQARVAGVSSFGVGGTNAHVVVQEAPSISHTTAITPTDQAVSATAPAGQPQLLLHSGKTIDACKRNATQIRALFCNTQPSCPDAQQVARTLRAHRAPFNHRSFSVITTGPGHEALITRTGDAVSAATHKGRPSSSVAFIVPGQGSQYAGMGQDLYGRYPEFKHALDQCFMVYESQTAVDLKAIMFSSDASQLDQTRYTQPALFSLGYALAALWKSANVTPCALLGHSIGDYLAAHLAGVFSLDDAIRLVSERGRLMQSMPEGSMLSVRLGVDALEESLGDALPPTTSVAAINGPDQCVIAGPTETIDALEAHYRRLDVPCRLLVTSHAFHSPMMDDAVSPFKQIVSTAELHAPKIPFVSSATGTWITDHEATSADYWAMHIRRPVKFAHGINTLINDTDAAFLEIGPGKTGTALATQMLRQSSATQDSTHSTGVAQPTRPAVASLPRSGEPRQEQIALLAAAGSLWVNHLDLDLEALMDTGSGQPMPLPGYAFEPTRYWLEPAKRHPVLTQPVRDIAVTAIPAPHAETPPPETIQVQLRRLLTESSGINLDDITEDTDFVDAGLDSLFMTRTGHLIKDTFDINVSFRDLSEKYCTLSLLSKHIESLQPATKEPLTTHITPDTEQPVMTQNQGQPPISEHVTTENADAGDIEALITAQLQIMHEQLDLLRGANSTNVLRTNVAGLRAANDEVSHSLLHKQQTLMNNPVGTTTPRSEDQRVTSAKITNDSEQQSSSAPTNSDTPAYPTSEQAVAAYRAAGISTIDHPPTEHAVLGLTDTGEAAWFMTDPEDSDALIFYQSA